MKKMLIPIFTAGLLGSASAQLVAYWSFDSDFNDATGNHNGTAQNGAILTTGDLGFNGGEALSLNGGTGVTAPHVTTANPTDFDFDTDFTWHAYVKSASAAGGIFGRAPATPNIHNQGSKSLFFGGGNAQWDTGWVGAPSSSTAINDDTWHQVIVTFVAATDQLDIFVDPVAGASTGQYSGVHDVNRFDESTAHNDGTAETSFRIGHVSDNFRPEAIIGLIDEAAIFDTALSGAKLDQLINQGPASFLPSGNDPELLTPPTATLAATSIASGLTTRLISIRNVGATQDLTISGVSFSGDDAAMFSSASLPDPIGPQTSADLQINFNPTAIGSFTTSMIIASNDVNSPLEVAVTIVVIADPFFTVADPLVLGAVTTGTGTTQRSVEVTNSGLLENLLITSVNFSGAGSSIFSNASFPASIEPGASGMIAFDVDPNTASGDYSAVMAITSNSEGSPTTNLDVSITLLAPAPNSLIAYWSFDQDASERLGNHNGTLQNGATISTGGQGFGGGEALSLSGGSGVTAPHVTTANPESFDFNTDFTWHTYVKSASAAGGIFGRAAATPIIHNQGSKSLFFGGGNAQWDTGWVGAPSSNIAINDNEWHQVIVTFVADTDQLDIFVDPEPGTTLGQYSGVHDVNRFDEMTLVHNGGIANTSFRIGQVSDNFRSDAIDGLIDEAAVFNTALRGDQLDQLITNGPASFAGDQTVEISEFSVLSDPKRVTLTWNSRSGETFAVVYSTDLQSWDSDLDDGINADDGDSTTRTFNVEGLDEPNGQLFIRVVKQ